MNIDKELIQQLHDAYMIEYEQNLKYDLEYRKMKKSCSKSQEYGLMSNARLFQGKWSALIHVINDLRHILGLPNIGEDMNAYGYVFDIE